MDFFTNHQEYLGFKLRDIFIDYIYQTYNNSGCEMFTPFGVSNK